MASMIIDVSDVPADIRTFPDGVYEGQIKTAKFDVADSGDTFIVAQIEIYHPKYGTGLVFDRFYPDWKFKAKCLWMALQDWSEEQMAADPIIDLKPKELIGAQLLVNLGEKENKDTKKIYKNVVSPFYFPLSRAAELLTFADEEPPL